MSKLSGIIFNFILPVVVIVLLYIINPFLPVLFIIAYAGLRLYSGRAGVFQYFGKVNYAKDDLNKALMWFTRAYDTGKAKPKTKISYAYLLLKSGEIEKPEQILTGLLEKKLAFDEKMIARQNLALVLWKKGQLDEAIEMLQEVMKEYKTTIIYGSLGSLLILQGNLEKALEFNEEAYEYNSTNSIIRDNLGQNYYLLGDYEKARVIYEKLIPSNPGFPEAYYNYGLLLDKLGKKDEALDMLKKALNYKVTSLSVIKREDIETKIKEISEQS